MTCESSPGGLLSSLCCLSECGRDLVASSESVLCRLLSTTAPSSPDLGRARTVPCLGFHVEEVSVFVAGLQFLNLTVHWSCEPAAVNGAGDSTRTLCRTRFASSPPASSLTTSISSQNRVDFLRLTADSKSSHHSSKFAETSSYKGVS